MPRGAAARADCRSGKFRRDGARRDGAGRHRRLAYLYLRSRTHPRRLLVAILSLSRSRSARLGVKPPGFGPPPPLACLGAGFLLLETRSIVACALYFGSTWLVILIVVAAAAHGSGGNRGGHATTLSAAVALRTAAGEPALSTPCRPRPILALRSPGGCSDALVVPLRSSSPASFLAHLDGQPEAPSLPAQNLIGAMAGGFGEYLGMLVGHRALCCSSSPATGEYRSCAAPATHRRLARRAPLTVSRGLRHRRAPLVCTRRVALATAATPARRRRTAPQPAPAKERPAYDKLSAIPPVTAPSTFQPSANPGATLLRRLRKDEPARRSAPTTNPWPLGPRPRTASCEDVDRHEVSSRERTRKAHARHRPGQPALLQRRAERVGEQDQHEDGADHPA